MTGCPSEMAGREFTGEEIEEAVRNKRLLAVEVELSRACNFRCAFCYLGGRPAPEEELSEREIRDVVLQGRDLGARRIILVGGEPTIHPNVLEVIRFIKLQGLEVEMFTNGSRMTAELAKQLFEEGVRVFLKMSSFDEGIQDTLSGRSGSFKLVQRALQSLKDAGYPSAEACLGVAAPICTQNIDQLAAMWQWLRDQGIVPHFQTVTPSGDERERKWLHVDPKRLERVFGEIAEIDRERYGESWDPQPPLLGSRCLRHRFSCRVCSQGDVVACVGVDVPMGNIREQKLHDIISDSEVLEDLRNHGETIKGPCGSCERAERCYGCRGSAYRLTGDYLASDPLCWRNADRQGEIAHLPFPADGIVPQRPPMRIVDAVVSTGERSGEVSVTVSNGMPFAREDGTIDAVAYFEMMAQSIAALHGFKRLGRSEWEAGGYLVGAQKLEMLESARVGDRLRISVYKSSRFGNFATVRAIVSRNERVLARGEIRVWQEPIRSEEAAAASGG